MLFATNSTNYERGEPREKTTHGSLNTYISRIKALVDIMLIFMRVVNRALHIEVIGHVKVKRLEVQLKLVDIEKDEFNIEDVKNKTQDICQKTVEYFIML